MLSLPRVQRGRLRRQSWTQKWNGAGSAWKSGEPNVQLNRYPGLTKSWGVFGNVGVGQCLHELDRGPASMLGQGKVHPLHSALFLVLCLCVWLSQAAAAGGGASNGAVVEGVTAAASGGVIGSQPQGDGSADGQQQEHQDHDFGGVHEADDGEDLGLGDDLGLMGDEEEGGGGGGSRQQRAWLAAARRRRKAAGWSLGGDDDEEERSEDRDKDGDGQQTEGGGGDGEVMDVDTQGVGGAAQPPCVPTSRAAEMPLDASGVSVKKEEEDEDEDEEDDPLEAFMRGNAVEVARVEKQDQDDETARNANQGVQGDVKMEEEEKELDPLDAFMSSTVLPKVCGVVWCGVV